MNNDFLYWYEADVENVVDGDTADLEIRLGCGACLSERVRFLGINAWETRGENKIKGRAAKQWLKEQIEGKRVVIATQLDETGKYGRLIVDVYLGNRSINKELVALGHAVEKEY